MAGALSPSHGGLDDRHRAGDRREADRGRQLVQPDAIPSSVDVAPTVLHALGVPVSVELAGKPLTMLFDEGFVAKFPVRQTATYGPPSADTAERKGQPLDQEMIDRLRSLGYVR